MLFQLDLIHDRTLEDAFKFPRVICDQRDFQTKRMGEDQDIK